MNTKIDFLTNISNQQKTHSLQFLFNNSKDLSRPILNVDKINQIIPCLDTIGRESNHLQRQIDTATSKIFKRKEINFPLSESILMSHFDLFEYKEDFAVENHSINKIKTPIIQSLIRKSLMMLYIKIQRFLKL